MERFTLKSSNSHFIGRAGEYAVASNLLVRGVPVHFPAVDVGADLIVGEKIRVQVKSSRFVNVRGKAQSFYNFSLTTSLPNWKTGHAKTLRRDWSKYCDFVVCWGVNENRFWVIPTSQISGDRALCTLMLGAPRSRWTVNPEEIRALVGTGLNQRDVAKRLGVSEMSVSRACNGVERTGRRTVAMDLDKYEGAWGEIIAAVGLTNQIDAMGLYDQPSVPESLQGVI